MHAPTALAPETTQPPGIGALFLAFSGVAVSGFGGVMPFARRMLVEQRRWLSAEEFNEAYALAQFLPGGNILNLAVLVGRRFHGVLGSVLAVTGLIVGPLAIIILLGTAYARYGDIPAVHQALAGVAAAAAGLIAAMAGKMAEPLIHSRAAIPSLMAALAFAAVALAQLPLVPVVAILGPLSVALAWRSTR